MTVAQIERSKCVGSGVGWDCTGLQMFKITLASSQVLGPYVAVPAGTIAGAPQWQTIPLNDPSLG